MTAKAKAPCPSCGGSKVRAAAECAKCFHGGRRQNRANRLYAGVSDGVPPATVERARAKNLEEQAPKADPGNAYCPGAHSDALNSPACGWAHPLYRHHWIIGDNNMGRCLHCGEQRAHSSTYL